MNITHVGSVRGLPTSSETPTVFVVDGDPSVRESLELLIRSAGLRVRTAASAEEFLSAPLATGPCCLVVELRLPGMSGLELQKQVSDRTELPVIFVSAHVDISATVQAMKAGALEFLTKPSVGDVLLHAIRHAIERSQAELRELAHMRALRERYESLSHREREVMNLVVCGRLNKQVGGEFGISEITVKAHRGRVMHKMQAESLVDLASMATKLRLARTLRD